MENRSGFRITPQVILGALIVALGVIFLLDNFDIVRGREIIRYWPVLLIAFGVSKLVDPGRSRSRLVGFIFTFVGAALLADRMYILNFHLWDWWPLIIVIIGGTMIWRSLQREGSLSTGAPRPGDPADGSRTVSGMAFMGGLRRTCNSKDFRGGELTAIMGGCEIDLRECVIKEEYAVLDMFAFWGGIEVKVPGEWTVVIEGTPLLGGFDDKTRPPLGGDARRLIIKGHAIMGGVEISN
jgi:predicted membrane protein